MARLRASVIALATITGRSLRRTPYTSQSRIPRLKALNMP
jgi:hypothetical protein